MRRHPFIVAMRAGTLRQFGAGAILALTLTGGFATYRIATREALHPPSAWLTEADQESLVAALSLVGEEPGWRAGCVWEHSARSVAEAVDVPDGTRHYRATSASGRAITLALAAGVDAVDGYDEKEAPGRFCYVPTSR